MRVLKFMNMLSTWYCKEKMYKGELKLILCYKLKVTLFFIPKASHI